MPLLQYPANVELLVVDHRLNPHDLPLEEAGDCGANTLYLLGIVNRLDAMELSRQQNTLWINKKGKAINLGHLLDTYLFTDPTKHYENRECTQTQLMDEVQALEPGFGTFLFMKSRSNLGHFICIYKNVETHQIELADLQREEIIANNFDEPHRLEEYLSNYMLFYIPFELDAASPTKRHPRAEESLGSPSKLIPRRTESPRRAEHHASPPRQYAAESYASPVAHPSISSPPHKKKRGGTRRKRRTRRKN